MLRSKGVEHVLLIGLTPRYQEELSINETAPQFGNKSGFSPRLEPLLFST
jgi:hypothetical protein